MKINLFIAKEKLQAFNTHILVIQLWISALSLGAWGATILIAPFVLYNCIDSFATLLVYLIFLYLSINLWHGLIKIFIKNKEP